MSKLTENDFNRGVAYAVAYLLRQDEPSLAHETEFSHDYPFVRYSFKRWEADPESSAFVESLSWKPGVEFEDVTGMGDTEAFCDGVGKQHLTLISRHKPGRYPERVFYVRQWIDPDGQVFGKRGLRITTASAFENLKRGYRHEYTVRQQAEKGCAA